MNASRLCYPVVFSSLILVICGCAAPGPGTPVPPTPTVTFWQKLGIPQAALRVRDNLTNRRGNFPQLERKPPLKALADAANLESPNAAIKAAAEIKAEEDLAPQKIKALKYLGEIGCSCYDPGGEIEGAFLKGLDDCTPDVRIAAICAIRNTLEKCKEQTLRNRIEQHREQHRQRYCGNCRGSGDCDICENRNPRLKSQKKERKKLIKKKPKFCKHCQNRGCPTCQNCAELGCNYNSCCSKKIQKKLEDMAYGVNDNNCYKEPVPEIRSAAASLLSACPPIPEEPEPVPDERLKRGPEDLPPVDEGGEDQTSDDEKKKNDADKTDEGDQDTGARRLMSSRRGVVGSLGDGQGPQSQYRNTSQSAPTEAGFAPPHTASAPPLANDGMIPVSVIGNNGDNSHIRFALDPAYALPTGLRIIVADLHGREMEMEITSSSSGSIVAGHVGHHTIVPTRGQQLRIGILAE